MKLHSLTPILWVKDLQGTIDFYEQKLGFKCISKMERWANMHRDAVEIMLAVPFQEWGFKSPQFTGSLYVYADEIDEIRNELKDKAEVFYPIEDFDHGMREFAIHDCNGYLLQFGKEI
jgi:uncharacterized glyoxalase superfamily protein PhnB